jgi:adenylate cyclase
MTIPEEIEQFKIKLEQTADEKEKAEVLVEILKKCALINSTDTKPCIDHLLQLAENLNLQLYKAWGFYHLAVLKRNRGEYDASLDLSQQSLIFFEKENHQHGLACCYNIIGVVYWNLGNYSEALKNYFVSLKLKKEFGDKREVGSCYSNIGLVYGDLGNYSEALKNHFMALNLFEVIGDKWVLTTAYTNIGFIYSLQGNYSEALKNHFIALKLSEELGNKRAIAIAYNNIGTIHSDLDNYTLALESFSSALKMGIETGDRIGIARYYDNIGNIYSNRNNYPEALKNHFLALQIGQEIGSQQGIARSHCNIGTTYQHQGNYLEALKNLTQALQIFEKIDYKWGIANVNYHIGDIQEKQRDYQEAQESLLRAGRIGEEIGHKAIIKESSLSLTNVYKALDDFKNALKYHEKYHHVDSEMLGEQAQKQLTNLNFQHNMEQKEKDLEIEQLRNVELKKERDRSESLLLNILPAEVAEELKNKGTADAKLFDNVTVLFTDFKSFTTISERLTPQELVDELNVCFSAFDEIMGRYNIEKIKTVGDAYLAVSGLPLANNSHALDVIRAGIEIREFTKKRKQLLGHSTFDIRIGVHSGSVVAGIVGVKKFAYDIWGDTVNTAARMEQNSESGKINISETTFQLVKENFNCVYRGEIEAKNKGKMRMYFVN